MRDKKIIANNRAQVKSNGLYNGKVPLKRGHLSQGHTVCMIIYKGSIITCIYFYPLQRAHTFHNEDNFFGLIPQSPYKKIPVHICQWSDIIKNKGLRYYHKWQY